jgi:molybdate-binding protein
VRHRDGRYNAPFAASVLAGRGPVLVRLWRREQGLLCPPDNPDGLVGVADLARRRVALRLPGTGTRVLLERLLRDAGVDPAGLRGPEVASHLEAALAVAAGTADAALGLRSAADALGLSFVPVVWEPFDLALPEDALDAAAGLLDAAARARPTPGYDLSEAGAVTRP